MSDELPYEQVMEKLAKDYSGWIDASNAVAHCARQAFRCGFIAAMNTSTSDHTDAIAALERVKKALALKLSTLDDALVVDRAFDAEIAALRGKEGR